MPAPPDPEARASRYLSEGYQGAVYLIEDGGRQRVVKQPMGGPVARRLRQAMLRREARVYERLRDVDGVPDCHGLRADGSLVLGYIDGEAFHEASPWLRDREAFFAELLTIIQALHAAGVAHADLKRRGNILIDRAGRPWLLDFGAAVLGSDTHYGRWLFRQFCRMDLNAWIKLKYRRQYDRVSAEDAAFYRPTRLEAVARVLRPLWRGLTGRRLRKARRRRRPH